MAMVGIWTRVFVILKLHAATPSSLLDLRLLLLASGGAQGCHTRVHRKWVLQKVPVIRALLFRGLHTISASDFWKLPNLVLILEIRILELRQCTHAASESLTSLKAKMLTKRDIDGFHVAAMSGEDPADADDS